MMQTRFVLVGCDATAKKIFAAAAGLLCSRELWKQPRLRRFLNLLAGRAD
jgi:hypothetical protein